MPQLEPQQLYNALEKSTADDSFQPLYCFFGDEPYLVTQALNYLKASALGDGAVDFNLSSFYAADADISRVRDEVETLPMMAARRVVVLKEVQDLTDKEWETLEPILATPVDSTVFILTGGKLDKRKKTFKTLSDSAVMVEFKKPFENQIPGWIRHIAKAYQVTISNEALALFHRMVGSQLTEIEAEIRKLKDYLGERTQIELEDVAQVVSQKKEENVFELTESIGKGNQVEALMHLVKLLDQGQNEIGIVSLVSRHMRILMTVKEGQEQHGLAGQKLAQYAQVPPYYLQDYVGQARAWKMRDLENTLLTLSETDRALKSSPLSSHIWLENMILKTCKPRLPSVGLQ